MPRTLLVFGAGPGIGDNIASVFAARSSIDHVVLLGRDTNRLQNADAPFVRAAAPDVNVDTVRVDLSDLESLPGVLAQLDALTRGEEVEVVHFNAARIRVTDGMLDVGVGEIEEDLRTQVLALHLLSRHYIPRLQTTAANPPSKPALLVTSSHLPWSSAPQLLSLSLVKAAQRTQVIALNRAFGASGVHCALVSVEGAVGGEKEVLSPGNIAREAFELWRRGEVVEVNLREPGEGEG